jgi:phosphoribosylformylglycinamidine cyclo-ligase
VDELEMYRVFNMGIGLILVVAEYYAEAIVRHLARRARVPAWIIGEVVAGERTVIWDQSSSSP